MWAYVVIMLGLAYCTVDFVLAILLGRCVMPGLKCVICRTMGKNWKCYAKR